MTSPFEYEQNLYKIFYLGEALEDDKGRKIQPERSIAQGKSELDDMKAHLAEMRERRALSPAPEAPAE